MPPLAHAAMAHAIMAHSSVAGVEAPVAAAELAVHLGLRRRRIGRRPHAATAWGVGAEGMRGYGFVVRWEVRLVRRTDRAFRTAQRCTVSDRPHQARAGATPRLTSCVAIFAFQAAQCVNDVVDDF